MARNRPSRTDDQRPHVPLHRVLARRRMRYGLLAVMAILSAVGLSLADHAGLFVYPGDMLNQYEDHWFKVTRVVDGDTLDIQLDDGKTVRLRLWGIDTPEIANQSKGTADQPMARQAMAWTTEHCQNKQVKLKLQPQRIWGTYGRLLCYVYMDNGQMLNEQLLLNGLARTDQRFVHEHHARFDILQEQAQFNRVGLWAK
ncbi:MAG: thermonuclease family protein [Phycisphaeraceae bacterium JB051]